MEIDSNTSCILIIFGGTGDLTHRKLMPALYNLTYSKMLPQNFAVVSIGRRSKSSEEYRKEVHESVKSYSRLKIDSETWNTLSRLIYYFEMDFNDNDEYIRLSAFLKDLDQQHNTGENRLFYLAVAPELFSVITINLHRNGMAENQLSWQRIMIEKPFGRDLQSAKKLNGIITDAFSEKNIFRIDHYLGKEMLQNIMAIRFANMLFEPVWNSRFIDNIQISSVETVGVENRGGYYEASGALRDMVQNHLLQLLTLTAMEAPVNLEAESIRDEKVKVLRSLEQLTPELIRKNIIRGQYGPGIYNGKIVPGYRQEERISASSEIETFIALKVNVDNFRWAGTPFYIRTGKRMPYKYTEIIIQFKQLPEILYFKNDVSLEPNFLVIKIQPTEGVFLRFNAKRPGTDSTIIPVQMDFCQNCIIGVNSPEAYERLIHDAIRGDSTLFTRWDEVEYSWRYVDKILEVWNSEMPQFPNYAPGDWGPKEADELLKREKRQWWRF